MPLDSAALAPHRASIAARVRRTFWESPAAQVLVAALAAVLLVAGASRAGLLRTPELAAYDRLLATRVATTASPPHVAVVEFSEVEVRARGGAISDDLLGQVLDTLLAHAPAAIGLALYRDSIPAAGVLPRALRSGRVVVPEALGQGRGLAVAAPARAGCAPTGFVNLEEDWVDGVARRSALMERDSAGLADVLHVGMPYQLAQLALFGQVSGQPAGCAAAEDDVPLVVALDRRGWSPLERGPPGARDVELPGLQLLLAPAYRPERVPTLGVPRVLAGGPGVDSLIRGRMVIVGSVAASVHRPIQLGGAGTTPTPVALALAAEQLVEMVRGTTPALRTWSAAGDWVWLISWTLLGAVLAVAVRGALATVAGTVAGVLLLCGIAVRAMGAAWVIPVLPPALGWFVAIGMATWFERRREQHLRAMLMGIFARHLSPELAAQVWMHRAEFMDGGRPRPQQLPVTVLFADLRGYSTMVEQVEPSLAMAWIDAFVGAMARAVGEHGGVVDDYAGDGIKADFGVPIARQTEAEVRADARRAVACALAMRGALDRLRTEWEPRGITPPGMRIGLHSGTAIAGTIGGDERLKYTVVGDTVNVAARLEGLDAVAHDFDADPCRILITNRTADLIAEAYVTEPIGEFVVKGRTQPVAVCRVLHSRAGVGSLTDAALRPDAPPIAGRIVVSAGLALLAVAARAGAQSSSSVGRASIAGVAHAASPVAGPSAAGQLRAARAADIAAARRRVLYMRPGLSQNSVAVGTRGARRDVPICVLAPRDHDGQTLVAQPTVAWWVAPGGPWPARVSVAVRGTGVRADTTLMLDASGVHRLAFATLGISVPVDSTVRWRVVLARGATVWSDSAGLRRVRPNVMPVRDHGSVRASLARARRLAEDGVWYDALDMLSRLADPHARARSPRTSAAERVGAIRADFLARAGVLGPNGC